MLSAACASAGCISGRNNTLSLDFYTPPAVAGYPPQAPSVDSPSVRSPLRDNWTARRYVVPIARPWTQASMRLGDWPADSDGDRAAYPFPAATAVDPGEDVAFPAIPMFFELGSAALELALVIPRTPVYTSFTPKRETLDPFVRATAWERAGRNPDASPPSIRQGAPAVGSDGPPHAKP